MKHLNTSFPEVINVLPVLVWNGDSQEHHSLVSLMDNAQMTAYWQAIEDGAVTLNESAGGSGTVVFAVTGDMVLLPVFETKDQLEAAGHRVRIVAVANPRRLYRAGDVAWEHSAEPGQRRGTATGPAALIGVGRQCIPDRARRPFGVGIGVENAPAVSEIPTPIGQHSHKRSSDFSGCARAQHHTAPERNGIGNCATVDRHQHPPTDPFVQ